MAALRTLNQVCGLASIGDFVSFSSAILQVLAGATDFDQLNAIMDGIGNDLGFRYYALIHHVDLRDDPVRRIELLKYPLAATKRIIDAATWRRDPVIRGCVFSQSAFIWSDLPKFIELDRSDRGALQAGRQSGLNEGITVPCMSLTDCMGSCTFAGTRQPERAARYLGMVQMIGIFAFQAAKRILGGPILAPAARAGLHPRPRDCIILAGRGKTNKEIARHLNLTPRTVDGYLREARARFGVNDRTELVVAAILAGEIGLHEVAPGQPA
ncbi:MAG TPA: LuxR family transcriptional regulator [Sphingobium sp.]|uniref:helix-turn-helix transcriptional regulator n=1 Tax=Sphingobium sp. TaxID=1912891 RepID=UPI002ED2EF75